MRVSIAVALLFFASLQSIFAQTPTRQSDEQSLRDAESSLLRAENENNEALLATLLASDFRSLTPDGRTFDKSQILQDTSHRSTMHFPYKVEQSGMHIFIFGNTALAAYTKTYVGNEGEVAGKSRKQNFIDVFSKNDSGWKLCFTKAESLPTPDPTN